MKKIAFLLLSFLFVHTMYAQSTAPGGQLTGLWYSSDSTRIYEIKAAAGNDLVATIHASSRKNDAAGFVVIRELAYNAGKKRYEGIMYAAGDGQPVFVKIKFDKENNNKIVLQLKRVLLKDLAINWVRANENIDQTKR